MLDTTVPAQSQTIAYKEAVVHYLKFGNGAKALFALHGYADSAELYVQLAPSLATKYTIYSIDLPYHGETKWRTNKPFSAQDISNVVAAIALKEQVEHFSLLGYSMGGKIVLEILPLLLLQVEELFLIASSGIIVHPVYQLIYLPLPIIRFIGKFVQHPALFFKSLLLMRKIKIISPFIYHFSMRLTETEEGRQRLLDTWIAMRKFKTPFETTQAILNNNPKTVYVIVGEKDDIVLPKTASVLKNELTKCTVKVARVNRGHLMVNKRLNATITDLLSE